MRNLEELEETIRAYLGMDHRLVGIKILKEDVDGNPSTELRTPPSVSLRGAKRRSNLMHPAVPMTFCKAVRETLGGKELVIGIGDLDCASAELCLGFQEPMFVDVEPRIKSKTKAVRIGPLEDADVVLFVLNPEQVMIMSILLGGIKAEFKGEMAICGEAVAKVYNEGEPNVSFLCSGARDLGGFEAHEIVLSLPYALFLELPDKMTKFASLSRSV